MYIQDVYEGTVILCVCTYRTYVRVQSYCVYVHTGRIRGYSHIVCMYIQDKICEVMYIYSTYM